MNTEKTTVALASMLASAGLALAKLMVGLATGSLGILSEAAHSLLDFGATVLTYFAVRISDKPADRSHPYGHAKIESVAALAETGLLLVASVWIVVEAIRRLVSGESHVAPTWWAMALILASIAIDWQRSHRLGEVARATHSPALEADALHFTSDMWSSAFVLAGLVLVWAGLPWADALAALIVAVFVALAGIRLGRRTIDTLIDTAPRGATDRIEKLINALEGVLEVDRVRVRSAGAAQFVEAEIAVRRTLPLEQVDSIKNQVRAAVAAEFPNAEINVVSRSIALDDESVAERVQLVAARHGHPVHHITVQQLRPRTPAQHGDDERLSVAFDLEIDGKMPLAEAHGVASRLEEAIASELGPGVEVESHIEPMLLSGIDGREVEAELVARVGADLKQLALADGRLAEIHDVRVRRTAQGLFVTFHCQVAPERTVEAVHDAVDDLETAFGQRWPEVRRVIAHAEPRR